MTELKSTSMLLDKLRGVLRKQRLVLFIAGLATTLAVLLLSWLLLSLVARVMILPVGFKLTLLAAATLLSAYVFSRYALSRLFGGDVDGIAVALEQKNTNLRGRLIAAVQFARSTPRLGVSQELIEVTEAQALAESGLINFNEVISFHPVWRRARMLGGAVVLALGALLISPGLFDYAFEVYSNPTTRVAPPIAYSVFATPETGEWIKYRDVKIGGGVVGARLPERAYIHHRLAGGSWQKTRVDLVAVEHLAVASGDSLPFGVTLRQINRSFDFFVEAGEVKTEIQRIDVVDRPRVVGIKSAIFYPDYTGLEPLTSDENNGSFSAVVGSRCNMSFETNLPVTTAEMIFDGGSRLPLKVENKLAKVSLLVDKSVGYHVELRDHLGESNPDPIAYHITAIPDELPSVDVIRPGYDVNLNDEMLLPLLIRIFDDYGFSSLVMKYTLMSPRRTHDEHVAVLHFSEQIQTQGDVEFNWDMESLNLSPGDYVKYHFEIADNDLISGPKVTRSRQYLARLPSLDEMIADQLGESAERIERTEDLVRSGKELVERLKLATRKMKAEPQQGKQADWQQQKEVESIAQRNEELMEQIDKTAEQMAESLEKMQENSLYSREIMEMLEQIRKLFEEIATDQMREAQKKLAEAMKKMSPEEMAKAMEDFKLSQEEMLDRLKRTLALLKKMQVTQMMESMVRKMEELVEKQSQMNEETAASEKEQLPNLGEAEKKLARQLEALKDEVASLKKMMQEAEMADNQASQKFAQALEKTDADQDMQQMSKSLERQEAQEAGEQGKSAKSKMMQVLDEMRQQLLALKGGDDDAIRKAMRKAIDHANHLSRDQEELIREAQTLNPRSMALRDVAISQQDLTAACAGLGKAIADLAKESPFVAAELSSLLGATINNMELATGELSDKQGSPAVRYQQESMFNLNKAAVRLMESMEDQSNCENGKNCDKPMSQLESLCKKQNKLNKQSQGMCDNPGMSQGGQQQMPTEMMDQMRGEAQRLAGEQGTIRKSLEQLEREFGGSRQILGRLKDIATEMKAVEEAMAEGEIGTDLVERQLNIYSRMLQATRSLQRKDFTEQRQAASAGPSTVYVPPTLPAELLNDRVELEDRLRKFLGEGYPPQYEEQIKAYFKALLKAAGTPEGATSGR